MGAGLTAKLGFAGTSDFAAALLQSLIVSAYKPDFVITQPDSRSGRGKKILYSPVKHVTLQHNIPCLQPQSITAEFIQQLKEFQPSIILVVAYGQILPQEFLQIPEYGCINLHTSLLPHWRGAAPIVRSIEAGDKQSGISLMQVIPKLDAGPILLQKKCPIEKDDTAGSLEEKFIPLAIDAIKQYFENPEEYPANEQPNIDVSYAAKISKEECEINWNDDAEIIARRIKAFNPKPGCYSWLGKQRVKIWRATAEAGTESGSDLEAGSDLGKAKSDNKNISLNKPGFIMRHKDKNITADDAAVTTAPTIPTLPTLPTLKVQCGKGILNIQQLQFEGQVPIETKRITGNSPLDNHNSFNASAV